MSTAALFLSKNIASIRKAALTCFPRPAPLLCSYSGALATSATTQPRHSQNRTDVLTAAFAAVLLIFGRSSHEKNCAKIHASMILHSFLHG